MYDKEELGSVWSNFEPGGVIFPAWLARVLNFIGVFETLFVWTFPFKVLKLIIFMKNPHILIVDYFLSKKSPFVHLLLSFCEAENGSRKVRC